MAKPVNEYYQRLGETPDALVELGKINDDGVKSGFKVTCAEENGQIKPHYLQLDNSGTLVEGRKGGTIARGGGSFQVKHGDYVRDGIPGVYIDDCKIAALGLRVRRHCTYHGLSLNVNMDLTPFEGINPCGIKGMIPTQLINYKKDITLNKAKSGLLKYLLKYLNQSSTTLSNFA